MFFVKNILWHFNHSLVPFWAVPFGPPYTFSGHFDPPPPCTFSGHFDRIPSLYLYCLNVLLLLYHFWHFLVWVFFSSDLFFKRLNWNCVFIAYKYIFIYIYWVTFDKPWITYAFYMYVTWLSILNGKKSDIYFERVFSYFVWYFCINVITIVYSIFSLPIYYVNVLGITCQQELKRMWNRCINLGVYVNPRRFEIQVSVRM